MIAALARRFDDGHLITITGDTDCHHPFHADGLGGTAFAPLGGGWEISHCPLEDCGTVIDIHHLIEGDTDG